ncbi:hypothetical protein HZA40_03970, partial [Candidatus Peregrinibacteria bacterium]|nr:hypothetical protein [Candidatus Peregrinibacteria bacterium]
IGQILSAAMMLKFSFSMNKEHDAIIMAVEKTLNQGYRTRDIFVDNTNQLELCSTSEIGSKIAENLDKEKLRGGGI